MKRVLLLDCRFQAVKVISWQSAITMLYTDKIDVVVFYPDETIRSPSIEIKAPAVVKLKNYTSPNKKVIKFSRQNIYSRDKYTCNFCGVKFAFKELTYDHLQPRSRGGLTNWENIHSVCYPCNSKKGSKSCEEAKMWPRVKPFKPKTLPVSPPLVDINTCPAEWVPFLPEFM